MKYAERFVKSQDRDGKHGTTPAANGTASEPTMVC